MAQKIVLKCKNISMPATLDDSPAAETVASNLPITGLAQTRGAEVFFFVDFSVEMQNPTEEAPTGTIAYWPAGSAICIFYGSAPLTEVEPIGKLDGAADQWRRIVSGDEITMEKA